jgi:hypothetical protein
MSPARRSDVFVSYSHADSAALARLRTHLRPFEREGRLEVWADTRLRVGDQWRVEIESAMRRAAAAILLVSADFLASDFIANDELPPLLAAADAEGVRILPVILKPCAFADLPSLSRFQAVNDPRRPLISLPEAEQEELWYQLAIAARSALVTAAESIAIAPPVATNVGSPLAVPQNADATWPDIGFLIEAELRRPSRIDDFLVYSYEHIDIQDFMPRAEDVLEGHPGGVALLNRVKARFRRDGWEGDGTIRLMWFPPFLGIGVEDTYGVAAWYVKQSNNGTSFIASPVPIEPLERAKW